MKNNIPINPYYYSIEGNGIKDLIYEHGKMVVYPANTTIINGGEIIDCFYFIDKGSVMMRVCNEDGRDVVTGICEEGYFIGAASLLSQKKDSISVTTKTRSVIFKLSKEKFMNLINTSDVFRNEIVQNLATIAIQLTAFIESISFKSCKERIYEFLYSSIDEDSFADHHWYLLKHPYTHQEMADIVGASRSTVSRLIGRLCTEDLVRIVNHKIQVKKRPE